MRSPLNLGPNTLTFGNGMAALEALQLYKQRRKLKLQPTRALHAGMNEFQRTSGYRVVPYATFVDAFFTKPRTDDMVAMLDDLQPYAAYLRGEGKHP